MELAVTEFTPVESKFTVDYTLQKHRVILNESYATIGSTKEVEVQSNKIRKILNNGF